MAAAAWTAAVWHEPLPATGPEPEERSNLPHPHRWAPPRHRQTTDHYRQDCAAVYCHARQKYCPRLEMATGIVDWSELYVYVFFFLLFLSGDFLLVGLCRLYELHFDILPFFWSIYAVSYPVLMGCNLRIIITWVSNQKWLAKAQDCLAPPHHTE